MSAVLRPLLTEQGLDDTKVYSHEAHIRRQVEPFRIEY
jgi:hypothetical protein